MAVQLYTTMYPTMSSPKSSEARLKVFCLVTLYTRIMSLFIIYVKIFPLATLKFLFYYV